MRQRYMAGLGFSMMLRLVTETPEYALGYTMKVRGAAAGLTVARLSRSGCRLSRVRLSRRSGSRWCPTLSVRSSQTHSQRRP